MPCLIITGRGMCWKSAWFSGSMSLYKGYQKAADAEESRILDNAQRALRARNKNYEPGLVSLLTHRSSGLEHLFIQDDDYLVMLGLLKESAEKFSISYYALSLLPNQIQILMRPMEKNLVYATRWIFSRYAACFNQKYQRRGHLFEGPYRQSVSQSAWMMLIFWLPQSIFMPVLLARAL